jgi:hypothetical protein
MQLVYVFLASKPTIWLLKLLIWSKWPLQGLSDPGVANFGPPLGNFDQEKLL